MSGSPVLQRLADQIGYQADTTAKPTCNLGATLIVPPFRRTVAAIDVREFARFVVSGVSATIGNMAAVWLTRRFLSFEIALLAGIGTAVAISFALSKFFAFRSRSWNRAVGEAGRFLIVYATGCAVYWMVAVSIRMFLLAHGVAVEAAEPGGILVGAGTMMLTSYSGHRFFTYRTYQRAKHCAAARTSVVFFTKDA
jgi:putative flippase GtrA